MFQRELFHLGGVKVLSKVIICLINCGLIFSNCSGKLWLQNYFSLGRSVFKCGLQYSINPEIPAKQQAAGNCLNNFNPNVQYFSNYHKV